MWAMSEDGKEHVEEAVKTWEGVKKTPLKSGWPRRVAVEVIMDASTFRRKN